MNNLLIWPLLALSLAATPALADSISGSGSTTGGIGGDTITTGDIVSTNSGSVTAKGVFSQRSFIRGGTNNQIGVAAIGASVLVSITHEGGNSDASGNDAIVVGTITASNSGTVSSTGIFNGASVTGGTSNGYSVSAAGTSVTISIAHR